MTKISGVFSATGTSAEIYGKSKNLLSLVDVGSNKVLLEMSLDDGSTWSTLATFVADKLDNIEWPNGDIVKFRLNCSVFSAGSINYMMIN